MSDIIDATLSEDRQFVIVRRADGSMVTIPDDPEREDRRALDAALAAMGLSVEEPAPPAIETLRAEARARVVAYADAITARITARYPASEVASWPTQAMEARAIKGGAGAEAAPLLAALAQAWDMPLAALADAVLVKAATYAAITAEVIKIRDAAMAAIDAAADGAALGAAMTAAKAQADAAAALAHLT